MFRLIHVEGGKHPVYLITNLTQTELPDRDVLKLYRGRWGIEVCQAGYIGRSHLYLEAA